MMWSNAESSFVQCAPSDGYIFDVLVKNSGGYKTFTDMQLIPVRESDYEPSIYDPETGLVQGQDYVTPNSLTLFKQKVETICFLKMYIFIFVRIRIMTMM